MHSKLNQFAVAAILALTSLGPHAQSEPAQSKKEGGVPVGPLVAYPGVDISHGRDNNLFLNNANRRSSSLTTISPYVTFEGKTGPHTVDVTARLTEGRFHNSRADDYTNWSLTGNAGIVFSGRANPRQPEAARRAFVRP